MYFFMVGVKICKDCTVKIMYFAKEALFKIYSPNTKTLFDLLNDCIQYYQISDVFFIFNYPNIGTRINF